MTLDLMRIAGSTPRSARSNVSVPFLPGFKTDGFKTSHHKSQSLVYGPGGATDTMRLPEDHPAKSQDVPKLDLSILQTLADPTHRFNYSTRSLTHAEREAERESARNTYRPGVSPAWLQHDRQVLRFAAYFQEAVQEDPKENYRQRHCVIYFYLEDGTMMITEPKVENSGIPQGTFVKRHRIPKPGGGAYTVQDLRNSINISVYSRVFRITGCDEFTRAFYESVLGMDVGADEGTPMDPFTARQLEATAQMELPLSRDIAEGKEYNELAHGGNRRNAKLQQYLENDRRILCFKCYWDDPTRYGSRMYYLMHYYLADDTVEMLESLARNSGRDPYPVFWRRSPLRKNPHVSTTPGMLEPEPVLYKPEDFFVGRTVKVYGRDIMLYDCDAFTREFYRQFMHIEQESLEIKQAPPEHVVLSSPPHVGFGTEEDSHASCMHLTPRPPRRDINKMMNEAGKVMRFEGRMVNNKQEDENRRFIICCYIADNGVGVWESRQRNTGHTEGKFALKSRKKNPATGDWFKPQDFVVGTVVEINGTPFLLLRADENTLAYMEKHSRDFPVADFNAICEKLQGLRAAISSAPEAIDPEDIATLAKDACGVELVAHELLTLVRATGDPNGPGLIGKQAVLSRIFS
mmetsp:Transcript_22009/g.61580  ORF Transcript_22009/g.61580 Transcript_22009/m.61580 type:complete len:632 (-) Transcript_22009:85-1980(-)